MAAPVVSKTSSSSSSGSATKQTLTSSSINFKANSEQLRIITEQKACHIQIRACAGSGKTTTILHRVKYLISQQGVKSERILITAFNIEAAKSLRNRLAALLGDRISASIRVSNIDKLSKAWVSQSKKCRVETLCVREYTSKLVELMSADAIFAKSITRAFDYIFFDEFQDINVHEYALLKIFSNHNVIITFVGDDAQNIYGFRESRQTNNDNHDDGDNDKNHKLGEDFPRIVRHSLSTNYRSTQPIVSFANEILNKARKQNYDMVMTSIEENNKGECPLPELTKFMSINEQNDAILTHIAELRDAGVRLDSIAILSRTNKPLQFIEEALEVHNNQVQKRVNNNGGGGGGGGGGGTVSHNDFKLQPIPYVAFITDNKDKQAATSKTYQRAEVKPNAATATNNNTASAPPSNRLTLTTIHKAKGLEWDVVFLISLNDDFFPGTNQESEEEEERRVFYVGITRARRRLEMSFVFSRKNQNVTRFISQCHQRFYSGFSQPLITEQTRCNEQMRQVDKIKSKTILLNEAVEFLSRSHFESLRNLGCLDARREAQQIHFKLAIGQYVTENNLAVEFAAFFKAYLLRSIGEYASQNEYMTTKTSGEEEETPHNAFNNKFCQAVLFSASNMLSNERGGSGVRKANFAADSELLSTQFISDQQKREEILRSLIAFQDESKASDSILKDIFNVSMCQSIFNQRRRLLHRDDAYKYFEMSKNVLRNAKKDFLPALFKDIDENTTAADDTRKRKKKNMVHVSESLFCETFQLKADYDIITDNAIYEINFQQQKLIKPEDIIALLAKAAILDSAWQVKVSQLVIYYPLQGEMLTLNLDETTKRNMQDVLKIIFAARLEKQEVCGQKSQNTPPNLSQNSQAMNAGGGGGSSNNPGKKEEEEEEEGKKLVAVKKKQQPSLFEQYGEESYADMCDDLDYIKKGRKDVISQTSTSSKASVKHQLTAVTGPAAVSSQLGFSSVASLMKKPIIIGVSSCGTTKQPFKLPTEVAKVVREMDDDREVSLDRQFSKVNIVETDRGTSSFGGFIRACDMSDAKRKIDSKKSAAAKINAMKEMSLMQKIERPAIGKKITFPTTATSTSKPDSAAMFKFQFPSTHNNNNNRYYDN